MAGISVIANRDSVTLYRTFSYRDGGKRPRNDRKTIGKVIPGTNRVVLNDYFVTLMASQGLGVDDLRGKTLAEIARLVDFRVEAVGFEPRRLHHDNPLEIDDPRLFLRTARPSRRQPRPAPAEGPLPAPSPAKPRPRKSPPAPKKADPAGDPPAGPLEAALKGLVEERLGLGAASVKARPLSVKSLGLQLVLERVAEDSGLAGVCREVFPDTYPELLTLAFHLVSGGGLGDGGARIGRVGGLLTAGGRESPPLEGARLERILSSIDEAGRRRFERLWALRLGEGGQTVHDLPAAASPEGGPIFLANVPAGREGGNLNLAVLEADRSGLPLRIVPYPGPPSEAGALLAAAGRLGGDGARLVLGQRFYETGNIQTLLEAKRPGGLMLRAPLEAELSRRILGLCVEGARSINHHHRNERTLFTLSTPLAVEDAPRLRVHAVLDENATIAAERLVYIELFRQKRDIESLPGRIESGGFDHELFRHDPEDPRGPLMVRHQLAADRYRGLGWLLAITDLETDPSTILEAFEQDEILETNFRVIRDGLALAPHHPGTKATNDRKLLLGLMALILMAQTAATIKTRGLEKTDTVPEVLRELGDIVACLDGERVLYSRPTDRQRLLLETFRIGSPAAPPAPPARAGR